MSASGIFLGTAGVYHVMSELALQNYHAAATHGNAPGFDILVCNETGTESVAIQVKSANWATKNIKGKACLDFPLGYKAGKVRLKNVFFAFVDFGVPTRQKPDVYLIKSTWLYTFCEPWIDNYVGKMVRFQPEAEWLKEYKNNWKQLDAAGILPSNSKIEESETDSSEA